MKSHNLLQPKDKWRTLLVNKLISLKHNKNIRVNIDNSRNNPVSFNYNNLPNTKKQLSKDIANDSNYLSKVKLPAIKDKNIRNQLTPLDQATPNDQACLFLSQGVQTVSPKNEEKPLIVFNTPPRIRIKMLKFSLVDVDSKITPKTNRVACKGIQTPRNYYQAMSRYLNNNLSQSTKNRNMNINYCTAIKVIRKIFVGN